MGCHALLQGIFLTQVKPVSLMSPVLGNGFFTTGATREAHHIFSGFKKHRFIILQF